jgi:23S rRNA pseudouridine2605 synthase
MMRLNRYMAQCGVAARRKCDDFIGQGKVKVNGKTVTQLGRLIDEVNDLVEFEGNALKLGQEFTYIVLNKPLETITSADDQHRRQTVVELVESDKRIFPVGRLDYNTTGVILLTDDGDLTNKLLHPKFKRPKKYHVLLDKRIKPVDLHQLRNGIKLDEKKTLPCKIKEVRIIDNCSFLEVELKEGRKRQIRLMFGAFDYEVQELDRIEFAGITYKGLKQGQWRYLSKEEIESLKEE